MTQLQNWIDKAYRYIWSSKTELPLWGSLKVEGEKQKGMTTTRDRPVWGGDGYYAAPSTRAEMGNLQKARQWTYT